MSATKPMIGLSGFLEPSLAPLMGSVITFSLLKGLVSGVAIGFLSKRVHSMPLGILAGVLMAALFSMLLILKAGLALFWCTMLPGMLLRVTVGFSPLRL